MATSLAKRLRAPGGAAASQARQRAHNAACLVTALAAAGDTPVSALLDAAKLGRADPAQLRAALWAASHALLIPALAPEAEVREECSRLCLAVHRQAAAKAAAAGRAAPRPPRHAGAPPGALAGVLPVAQLVETAGGDGALLLWASWSNVPLRPA